VAYDPAYYNIFLNVATSAPVVNAGTINNVGVPANATGTGVQAAYLSVIPRGQNPGARSQTRVSPDFHNPYVEQWSFGVERLNYVAHFLLRRAMWATTVLANFQTVNSNPLIFSCSAFTGDTCTGTASGLAVQAPQYISYRRNPMRARAGRRLALVRQLREDAQTANFTLVRTRNNGAWSTYHGVQE